MIRLHAVVEGQTEETFVREVLAPDLGAKGVFMDAHRITTGTRRAQKFRGGFVEYEHLKRDLALWMAQDKDPYARFTTMIDLYQLPEDFPGYRDCQSQRDPIERIACLEAKLTSDISDHRFIPYIQLHEFEALLFTDVHQFSIAFPNESAAVKKLGEIRDNFKSREHINDRPELSPSKRILKILPQYAKTVAALLIIQQIGLARLRQTCVHFDRWMQQLEALAK